MSEILEESLTYYMTTNISKIVEGKLCTDKKLKDICAHSPQNMVTSVTADMAGSSPNVLRWSYTDIDSKTSEMEVEECRWYICVFNDHAAVAQTT